MIKKLKKATKWLWQKIRKVDFEHFGFHFDNYTRLFLSTIGVVFFGAVAFMEFCYFPVIQVQVRMAVVEKNFIGALFRSWPLISWYISAVMCAAGMAWGLFEFTRSFSFWDSHHRRIIELRARINDAECGIGGDGRANEWLQSLKFEDSGEARKVANFVFLGKQLNFKAKQIKEIVEAHFKE